MKYLRVLVHLPTDAMAAIFPDDGISIACRMLLDRITDIPERRARPYRTNSLPHRFIRHAYQALRGWMHFSNQIGFAGVSDEAPLLQGDVKVDDVTILQNVRVRRHAVAGDRVLGAVEGIGIAILALTRWACAEMIHYEGFDPVVHLHRGQAGQCGSVQEGEYRCQKLSRRRNPRKPLGGLDHLARIFTK